MQRVEKRAQIAKSQSHQPSKLIFDTKRATPVAQVDRLRQYVDTVLWALEIMHDDLVRWRETGNMRQPRTEWIPAGKQRTRISHFPTVIVWDGEQPLPFDYVTDP